MQKINAAVKENDAYGTRVIIRETSNKHKASENNNKTDERAKSETSRRTEYATVNKDRRDKTAPQ